MKKSTLRKTLKYIGNYKYLMLFSIILAVISVLFNLYIPVIIGYAIDCIKGFNNVDFHSMFGYLIKAGVIAIITAIITWIMNVINNRVTYHVVRDVRNDAFKKIQILPFSYLDSHSNGDILSRVVADADQFADGLLMGFTQLFTGIVTIVGTFVFMIMINYKIALLVVLFTPLSLLVANFISKRTYHMFKKQSETRAVQTSFIDEIIGNQKVVHAFVHEKEAIERFDKINDDLEKYSLRATFFSSITNPSTRFVNNLIYAGVGLSGAFIVLAGKLTVGSLSCLLSYANQFAKPFNEISGVITELQNAFACADRLFELIEEQPQIPDKKDAIAIDRADGNIKLDNVCFSYTPDKKLIQNFNLSVSPGQRVAIVGPTGCGKTTLINLLMRFYDVTSGSIKVEGTDIRDITRKSLRETYGMVLQDTWLKSGTVKDNIIMGKPDATDEEIINAAKESHAHSFIKRLPNAYDTQIGEEGGNLSQGQKQLLCITRIMLALPPMLILDEATSSIDTRTELKVQDAFARLMKGRTSFIVAHRLSTIKDADIILVMKNGNIVEQGTHKELLDKNGFYSVLYNSQFEH